MDCNAPIGIFDSGVGGLTVAKEVRQLLPDENIIYVGDTARVPYGSRESEEIIIFMNQILRFFQRQGVKMAIVACNTMTTYGYGQAAGAYPFPIVPMNSAVKEAVRLSPHKRIGVIATKATVSNQMHYKAASELDADIAVYAKACPEFVPLIESGIISGSKIETAVQKYMKFFKGADIEALILACTHYPIINDIIQRYIGADVKLVNPARATVDDAVNLLKVRHILNNSLHGGNLKVCFSDDLAKARKMVKLVLNTNKAEYRLVNFAKY